jgi:SsrA-binding protein
MKIEFKKTLEIKNKKSEFDFEILQRFSAGIILSGTEVKSIRMGKANLTDGFCFFNKGELWVKNIHISEYINGGFTHHELKRNRKLLLKKKEIDKILDKVKERGLSVIPTRLFLNERNLIKCEVALVKGKKKYDKRESIKEKDLKREHGRNIKI